MQRLRFLQVATFALIVVGGVAAGGWQYAQPATIGTERVVEIRVYTLRPGERDRFHRRFVEESLPLLQRAHVDVVSYGPSLHDEVSYFLVRAYSSLSERTRSEDAFYGSREWIEGPRAAVMAAIDSYSTVVVRMSDEGLRGFRESSGMRRNQGGSMQDTYPLPNRSMAATGSIERSSDIATLLVLNDDYIRAVQNADAERFRDLLSDDFLCSLSNGSQIDRDQFLAQLGTPSGIVNLEAHDVNVRVMGDFALIHARTTFRTADGSPGQSRYTDTWARRNGRWVAVAAHITRY